MSRYPKFAPFLVPRHSFVFEVMLSRLSSTACNSILDVGCGDGRLLSRFAQHFDYLEITAVDVNVSALTETGNRVPKASLIEADASLGLYSLTRKFDIVLACHFFYYVTRPRWSAVFHDLRQSLTSPRGLLFITLASIDSQPYSTELCFPSLRQGNQTDNTDGRLLSAETFTDWLKECGHLHSTHWVDWQIPLAGLSVLEKADLIAFFQRTSATDVIDRIGPQKLQNLIGLEMVDAVIEVRADN